MAKSFYDLDYIIEFNEKRIEEFNGRYKTVHDKYSVLIIIYSAIAIFLLQLIQHAVNGDIPVRLFYICFAVFLLLYTSSIVNFIRLLLPEKVRYLNPPKQYYSEISARPNSGNKKQRAATDAYLKNTYIKELETTLDNIQALHSVKSHFYFTSLKYALLCALPFLVCLGFHIVYKNETYYQVELINKNKFFSNKNTQNGYTKDTIASVR